MVILWIHLIVSAITYVLYMLAAHDFSHKFKTRYPDAKVPKSSWAGKVGSFLRNLISSFIPIMNLLLLWVMLFHYEELERKTIRKIYEKCTAEDENA